MKTRPWLFIAAGALISALFLCAGIALFTPPSQNFMFRYFVRRSLISLRVRNAVLFNGDSLKVVLCGTSAPVPDPNRAEDCTAVFAGGKYYLVNAGPVSSRNLALWHLEDRHLGGVFLTHFQSDAIGDLGDINFNAWLYGHQGQLPVYGPPGVANVVDGFNIAYTQNTKDFETLVGPTLLQPHDATMQAIAIALIGPATPLKSRLSAPIHLGDLTVTAIEVNHEPVTPAYGYRFDYHGRSVVVSGNTNYHPPLAVAAQGADVLIHEAQSNQLIQQLQQIAQSLPAYLRIADILSDIQGYHTDPQDAARIANFAHARLLIFNHLSPSLTNWLVKNMFLRGVDHIRAGGWMIGQDGTEVTLPIGSTNIFISKMSD